MFRWSMFCSKKKKRILWYYGKIWFPFLWLSKKKKKKKGYCGIMVRFGSLSYGCQKKKKIR